MGRGLSHTRPPRVSVTCLKTRESSSGQWSESLFHSLAHTRSLSLSLALAHSHSFSLSHTHTHTLSLSHTRALWETVMMMMIVVREEHYGKLIRMMMCCRQKVEALLQNSDQTLDLEPCTGSETHSCYSDFCKIVFVCN